MKTELRLCLFAALSQLIQCTFFDSADVICSQKLKVSMELFDSWFHTTTLEIGDVHDRLIDDYMVCWMQERKFTDNKGEINYDALYEWVRKDVYRYFGKDITTHPLEERKEIAAKIIPECQAEVGFDQYINGKEIGAYNCIASRIGKL
ncbi:hypothetical protein PPYR_12025 [Photinus pyralis]|uniref:Uncharacterized protein n=1 Tax=Photinus pyralis TaxID=7054 RepID=A0A5N4ACZ2_PHOPY|nr:hypothetical protein PPYR_12025 [Photinus pyralis]